MNICWMRDSFFFFEGYIKCVVVIEPSHNYYNRSFSSSTYFSRSIFLFLAKNFKQRNSINVFKIKDFFLCSRTGVSIESRTEKKESHSNHDRKTKRTILCSKNAPEYTHKNTINSEQFLVHKPFNRGKFSASCIPCVCEFGQLLILLGGVCIIIRVSVCGFACFLPHSHVMITA